MYGGMSIYSKIYKWESITLMSYQRAACLLSDDRYINKSQHLQLLMSMLAFFISFRIFQEIGLLRQGYSLITNKTPPSIRSAPIQKDIPTCSPRNNQPSNAPTKG